MDMGEYIYNKFKDFKPRVINEDGIDNTLYRYYMTHGLSELGDDGCIAGQLAFQHEQIIQLREKLTRIKRLFNDG